MNNVIKLVEDIIKNMEYVRILFKRDKDITPLNTFNSVINKLNKLRYILENDILTPEQIMEAVRRLERPIKPDEDIYYHDSVGEEGLHENTEN